MAEIILFVGENCPACGSAETFLKKNRIRFEEIRVEEAREYARALGVMSVPTLIVRSGGAILEHYVGFQGQKYKEIVEKWA